jgi:hypothetical protein
MAPDSPAVKPDSRSALLISYQTDMLRPFGFIEPCLPTNARAVPTGPQWIMCVFSRRGVDHTEGLMALKVTSVNIDGEGVRRGRHYRVNSGRNETCRTGAGANNSANSTSQAGGPAKLRPVRR